ncbi:MAG: hypothetical protein AABX27_02485 [Nanoarchaeota archaeon]
MTKKTLEDKVKDANTAFGNEYSARIESMDYFLSYGISWIGVREPDAPEKDKNKPCLIAYLTHNEESHRPIAPGTLVYIARDIIPREYKGFKVFLEYREALKPRDENRGGPATLYGVPMPPEDETSGGMATLYGPPVADEGPVPAYGVPMPPVDDKKGPVPAYGVPFPPKDKKKKKKDK